MKKQMMFMLFTALLAFSFMAKAADYNPYKHDESFRYGLGGAWTNNMDNVFLFTFSGVSDWMVWRLGAEYTYHDPALSDYVMLGELGKRDLVSQNWGIEYGVVTGFNILRPADITPWMLGAFIGLDYNITQNIFAYATIQPYTYFKFGDTNNSILFGNGLVGLTYLF